MVHPNTRWQESRKVAYVLKVIYRKSDAFRYPDVFQCDNGSEFKVCDKAA